MEAIVLENLYKEVYSAMSQGVALNKVILDQGGNPIDYLTLEINESYACFLGKSKKEIEGKTILEVLPDLERSWIKKMGQVALDGNPKRFEKYTHELDKYFDVDVYSPEKYQFVVLLTDITERKHKEKQMASLIEELTTSEEEIRSNYIELERTKNEVEKVSRMKSQFLANLSHEIKTHLNGIVAFADLLKFTEMDKEQREYLQMIQASSKHLMDVLDNALDISKIEDGKFDLDYSRFNIKNVLDRVIKEFSFICAHRNLKFNYSIDPHIPLNIVGDELALNQVLVDLLNNIVKFTNEGVITLVVEKIFQLNDKINLQFEIKDNGIGISDNFAHSTSKELIKMMNGEIWIEKNGNLGSAFYFTAEFLIDIARINDSSVNELSITKASFSRDKTILVVEENEINMKIVTEMLKKSGYSVLGANNGDSALELFMKHMPGLILMDVHMVKQDGYETARIIRRNEAAAAGQTPIIGTVSYAMPGVRELCIEAGMNDYILKPFELNKLERIIKNYL